MLQILVIVTIVRVTGIARVASAALATTKPAELHLHLATTINAPAANKRPRVTIYCKTQRDLEPGYI